MNYEASVLRGAEGIADIGRDVLALNHVFGFDSIRKGNLHLIENDKIIFGSGPAVIIEDTSRGVRDFLLSIDDQGVGCVAVHPSRYVFSYQFCNVLYGWQGILCCGRKRISSKHLCLFLSTTTGTVGIVTI